MDNLPVVVLIGQVGVGKSKVVEKLTNISGISSASSTSYTLISLAYRTNRIIVIDTPGSNSMTDKFQHNLWIAQALNFKPVSLIMICAEAHTRIENTIESLKEYLERFQDYANHLCPIVTKMDMVTWQQTTFLQHLEAQFGINKAVFSSLNQNANDLLSQILRYCGSKLQVKVNGDNFLKYFKVNDNNLRILSKIRDEVGRYETINRQFFEQFNTMTHNPDKVDLIFEFQTYMTDEIEKAKLRVSDSCGFTMANHNEVGHIANMTNQMKNVLYDVRTTALGMSTSHGVTALKRCPYCSEIWTKVAGCDGTTTCGNRVNSIDASHGILASFSFNFDGTTFRFQKSMTKRVAYSSNSGGRGCGRQITWSNMSPVPIPTEFAATPCITVDDVSIFQQNTKHEWLRYFNTNIGNKAINIRNT